MSVKEIYESALKYLFEQAGEDADFAREAPGLVQALLWEALPYENSIRRTRGEAELSEAPEVRSMEDAIAFDGYICRVALPFGLAAYFWQDECDDYKAQDFRGRFLDALAFSARAWEENIS